MYKLLIVDDEEIVRTSIAALIDWSCLGFTEVYQAEHGVEALELCFKYEPDLVLTDIRMPFMDGLELSARLREHLPSTSIVILSGHDEFKYAQQALTYGVLDYILKPVSPETLTEKMLEIRNKLDLSNNEKKYLEKVRDQLHESLPLLVDKFLNSLLTGSEEKRVYSKSLDFLEKTLAAGLYLVCVLEPDLQDIEGNDRDIYQLAVKKIAAETFGSRHLVFTDNYGRVVIIYCADPLSENKDYDASTVELLDTLRQNINSNLNIQLTAAKGSLVNGLNSICMSYNEALSALESKYTLGKNKIYDINDIHYIEHSLFFPYDSCNDFIDAVKSTNIDLIYKTSASIVAAFKNRPNITFANIRLVFIELITSLLKLHAITKKASQDVWKEGLSLINKLDKYGTIEEISRAATEFAVKVSSELAVSIATTSSNIVLRVIDYIKSNYQFDGTSLFSAANHVHVNSSYLSTLFKKETGKNFIDYLNRVRVEKAMKFLQSTDLKTYEVAYQTGFSNPHYFSVLFKKQVGMSPSEFKGGSGDQS